MSLDTAVLFEIINARAPNSLKALDPVLGLKKKTHHFLDESFHSLNLLEKIDSSHFEMIYDSYPKKDIVFIQTHLKDERHKHLKSFLTTDCMKKLNHLYPCLPYRYMPSFAGSEVLFLNAPMTKQLIYLLGLYDLKITLKTLIDQKILNEVKNVLTDLQKMFLKQISKETEKVAFKKIPLESWDLQKSSFESLIYLRGLNRYAKSFFDLSPLIKNEFVLRLPLKDKSSFFTLSTKVEPSVKEGLINELDHAFNFMKKHLNF